MQKPLQSKLSNCEEIVIGNNSLSHSSGTSYEGIRLNGVVDGLVTQNDITGYDEGIYMTGNCLGTQLTCNELTSNVYGIYINNANMSDQGSSSKGSDNQWFTSVTSDIAGSSSTAIDWYYYNAGGGSYNPSSSASNVTTLGTSNNRNCNATIPNFLAANPGSGSTVDATFEPNAALSGKEQNELPKGIYPNPAEDHVRVNIPNHLVGMDLSVYNNAGQKVDEIRLTEAETRISLGHLSKGIYLLRVGDQQWKLIKK